MVSADGLLRDLNRLTPQLRELTGQAGSATAEMPMYSSGAWTKMPTTEATSTPSNPMNRMPPIPLRLRLVV